MLGRELIYTSLFSVLGQVSVILGKFVKMVDFLWSVTREIIWVLYFIIIGFSTIIIIIIIISCSCFCYIPTELKWGKTAGSGRMPAVSSLSTSRPSFLHLTLISTFPAAQQSRLAGLDSELYLMQSDVDEDKD